MVGMFDVMEGAKLKLIENLNNNYFPSIIIQNCATDEPNRESA